LSLGALLTALGLALWNRSRQVSGLSPAIRAIKWTAAGLLLATTPLVWIGSRPALVLHLTLAAAIATPPAGRRHHLPRRDAVTVLPALALAGAGFFLDAGGTRFGGHTISAMSLAVAVYSGLAARVLGEALGRLANPAAPVSRLFDALYLLLTLLVGANALATLWQRGVVWEASPGESGLPGVWLAWSAAWLIPHARARLKAGLIAVAAILLIVLALGTG
jgi:hypothetical protein